MFSFLLPITPSSLLHPGSSCCSSRHGLHIITPDPRSSSLAVLYHNIRVALVVVHSDVIHSAPFLIMACHTVRRTTLSCCPFRYEFVKVEPERALYTALNPATACWQSCSIGVRFYLCDPDLQPYQPLEKPEAP